MKQIIDFINESHISQVRWGECDVQVNGFLNNGKPNTYTKKMDYITFTTNNLIIKPISIDANSKTGDWKFIYNFIDTEYPDAAMTYTFTMDIKFNPEQISNYNPKHKIISCDINVEDEDGKSNFNTADDFTDFMGEKTFNLSLANISRAYSKFAMDRNFEYSGCLLMNEIIHKIFANINEKFVVNNLSHYVYD